MSRAKKGAARIFAASVVPTNECILWPFSVNAGGYGILAVKGKAWLAHRYVYSLHNTGLPKLLRHTCDVPNCINPSHLIGGSNADNMQDMVDRDRQCKGNARATKLSDSDVTYIRANYMKGKNRWDTGNAAELATKFSIDRSYLTHVIRGDKWSSV